MFEVEIYHTLNFARIVIVFISFTSLLPFVSTVVEQKIPRYFDDGKYGLQVRLLKDILDAWKKEVEKKPPTMSIEDAYNVLNLTKSTDGWVWRTVFFL